MVDPWSCEPLHVALLGVTGGQLTQNTGAAAIRPYAEDLGHFGVSKRVVHL